MAKDNWDKASVVAQFMSGVLLAAVGIVASNLISTSISKAQLESSDRKQTADYVSKIAEETDPLRRADLLGALNLSVRAQDAIRIAVQYASRNRTGIPSVGRPVYDRCIETLETLSGSDKNDLELLERQGSAPDSDIIAGILGEPIEVKIRVSQVDDSAVLQINGKEVQTASFGGDSEWVPVTGQLNEGNNIFVFVVSNKAGGSNGRLEISAGKMQFDTGLVRCDPSIENSPTFEFDGGILVTKSKGKIFKTQILEEGPFYFTSPQTFSRTCPLPQNSVISEAGQLQILKEKEKK